MLNFIESNIFWLCVKSTLKWNHLSALGGKQISFCCFQSHVPRFMNSTYFYAQFLTNKKWKKQIKSWIKFLPVIFSSLLERITFSRFDANRRWKKNLVLRKNIPKLNFVFPSSDLIWFSLEHCCRCVGRFARPKSIIHAHMCRFLDIRTAHIFCGSYVIFDAPFEA